MDAETLERLLMDRALGALSPDADALLTAYLEHDAEATERSREFAAAATSARHVLRRAAPATLPPFPAAGVQQLEQARRRLVWVRNAASMAAALVIGVGLGAWLTKQMPADGRTDVKPVVVEFVAKLPVAEPEPAANRFWSTQRLYEQARRTKRVEAARVIWDSPVLKPRLRGEL